MYGRVITINVKPGMLEAAKKLVETLVVPAAQKYAGFHHWYQMSTARTNKILSIALWANEEDMHAFRQREMQQIMGQMNHVMDFETMVVETYHVDIYAEAIPELIVDQIADAILESA